MWTMPKKNNSPLGANASSASSFRIKTKRYAQWYSTELDALWKHPDWTAQELHEIIPRHSPTAIRSMRNRVGRYNPYAIPLCQKCGEHPVAIGDSYAKRRGLCSQCAADEHEWEESNADTLRKQQQRVRQRRCLRKKADREDK